MGETALYEADALIPIDEYWDDYPSIKEYLSDEQWEKLRQPDGHIYWIPPFGISHGMMWRCCIMVKLLDSDKSIKMGWISKDYNDRAVL